MDLSGIGCARCENDSDVCRYGCDAVEDASHVLLHCPVVSDCRDRMRKCCEARGLDFNLRILLTEGCLQILVEKLMSAFMSPDDAGNP